MWCATNPAAPVVHARRLCSSDAQAVDQVEQGEVTVLQTRGLRGPVVHLRVDVDRELAVPGRHEALVPDSLQVRGERSGTAAREQEVAAELAVLRDEARIVLSGTQPLEPLVARQVVARRVGVESDSKAAEGPAVVADVPLAELGIRQGCRRVDRPARLGGVALVAEVGRNRDQHARTVGALELHVIAHRSERSAVGHDPEPGLERGAARAAFAAEDEVVPVRVAAAVELAVHVRTELELAGGVPFDVHHEHVVRGAREMLAADTMAVARVGDGDDPRLQIELAPVVLDVLLVLPAEEQGDVRELLVRGLVVRQSEQRELGKRMGLFRPPREEQLAHLVEMGLRVGVRPVEETRPERLLVDLERLLVDAAEDHASEPAVANRRRPEPPCGGRAPPQACRG